MKKFWITLLSVLTLALSLFGIVACSSSDVLANYVLKEAGSLVDADFVLPYKVNDKEVTWSSNSAAIAVEKRADADPQSWLAKVTLGDEQENVTLKVSCGKENKEFEVTVAALDVSYFVTNYKFKQAQSTVFADFDLETSTTINGKTASIAWYAGKDAEGNYIKEGEYIKISEDGTKCEVTQSSLNPEVKIYATFTYGGKTQTTTYRMTVSFERDHLEEVDYWYYNTGVSITMSGYVVAIGTVYSAQYNNITLYMVDDDFCAGYYLYRVVLDNKDDADKLKPGVHVTVTNTTNTNYSGLIETNAGGSLVVDADKPAINISEHITAIDDDILAKTPAALYYTSTLVSLDKWTVKSMAKSAPAAGATGTLFTLTKGGVDVAIGVSKYMEGVYATNDKDTTWKDLVALYGTIKVGDVVSVSGILGNYNGYQIIPLKAGDVKKEDVEASEVKEACTKTAAAIQAVQDAFKDKGVTYADKSAYTIVADKDITVPTEVDGVAITYEVLRNATTVSVADGVMHITVGNEDIATVKITYTVKDGETVVYTTTTYHNIHSVDMSPAEVVEKVKFDLEIPKQTTGTINLQTAVEQYPGATISYALKGEAVENVSLNQKGDKLEIVPSTTTERTVVLVATFTYGDATDTKEYTIKVVKVDPVETGTFKLMLEQKKLKKTLYFTGEINSSNFGVTTDWYYDAADVVVAEVEDGYTLKVGAKYLELNASNRLVLVDTSSAAWSYDYSAKVFTWSITKVNNDKEETKIYYLGTYGDFDTISASETWRITGDNESAVGVSQFVAEFIKPINKTDKDKVKDVAGQVPATLEIKGDYELPVDGPLEGVKFAYALEEGVTIATIEDGAIKIAQLPEEDTTFKITVTVTSGKESTTKTVTVTVKAAPAPVPAGATVKFDFSSVTGTGTNIANGDATEVFAPYCGNDEKLTKAETTNAYLGNGSGGNNYANTARLIKFGSGKATGTLKLTFSANVTKVEIKCVVWSATDNKLSVNGDQKTIDADTNADPIIVTFELATASQEIEIVTTNRALIFEIVITFAE